MFEFPFQGLGTVWAIKTDGKVLTPKQQDQIISLITDFENKYSRFKANSEVSQLIKSSSPIRVSQDLYQMLKLGLKLNKLTHGHFDLNINKLISGLGYDSNYSFEENSTQINSPRGSYQLKSGNIHKEGGVQIDLGSLGKGYLVDILANWLKQNSHKHFLIEGGGDIYVTTKADGTPWKIALEHPLNPDQAIGEILLKERSIASSTSNKRKFKGFHHLINPKKKKPVKEVLSISVISPSAFHSDALATALFVTPKQYWDDLSSSFDFQYLCVFPDMSFTTSPNFPDFSFS